MASLAKKRDLIRKRRSRKSGHKRRRALQNHGSTPPFPIHQEQAKEPGSSQS